VLVWVRLDWVHEHQDNTKRGDFYIETWICESWNLLVYDRVPQIVVGRPPNAEVINVTLMTKHSAHINNMVPIFTIIFSNISFLP